MGLIFVPDTVVEVVGLLAGGPVGQALVEAKEYFPRPMLEAAKSLVGDWAYLGKAWGVGLFWLVVCTAIGLYGFYKKEIK